MSLSSGSTNRGVSKPTREFKEGDKVFAKVRGYPPWPAVVLGKSGDKRFSILFYGTQETAHINPDNIFYYLKNKEKMMKGSKKKVFKDALEEIEKVIAAAGTDGDKASYDEESAADQKINKNLFNSTRNSENEGGNKNCKLKVEKESDASQPDVKIVSELNLKHWIIYADAVKKNPDLYKVLPIYQRSYFEKQAFPVLLSGKYVGLKLHKTWPLHFDNEYDCAIYDSETASRVLLLKELVSSGEVTIETNPEDFLEDFEPITEAEIKRDAEIKLINRKNELDERIKIAHSRLVINTKIIECLMEEGADPKKALEWLDKMLEIDVDEIMLKKHPHVFETVRRCANYFGNVEEWKLSPEEVEVFEVDAQKIRSKAVEIYKKFKSVVEVPPNTVNFWEGFKELVRKFREDSSHLSRREFLNLTAEPCKTPGNP